MSFPFILIAAHTRKSWFRSLLTMGSVFVAIFVFGGMRTVIESLEATVQGTSSRRMLTESAVSLFVNLPKRIISDIEGTPGVACATHWTWFSGTFVSEKMFFARFSVDPPSFRKVYEKECSLTPAEWEAFLTTRTGCIIGRKLAVQFQWKVGDIIPLKGSIFPGNYAMQIVGIYESKSTAFDEQTMFFQWEYMNEMSKANGGPPDVVSVFSMLLSDPDAGPTVARAIDERFSSSDTRTRTLTERAFQASFLSMWGNLPLFFNMLSIVALLATFMVTLNTMLLNARERVKETGILKTLGFSTSTLVMLSLFESLALCCIGGFLAAAVIGTLNGKVLPVIELPMIVPPSIPIAGVVVSIVLGLVSGLTPAMMVSRLKIVDALRRRA